jgi:hypothetical protein
MATLNPNDPHPWMASDQFTKLSFKWADTNNPGTGTVSVIIGDAAATSYDVPQVNIQLDAKKKGKLTNNTTKTIDYTLSK